MNDKHVTATILVENSAHEGLEAEHGLSVLVEARGGTILFDAGDSDMFLRNAKRLGVDLSRVSAAVLSHGHHDHAGGLPAACRLLPTLGVYLSRAALQPKYSKRDGELQYAGVPDGFESDCGRSFQFVNDGDEVVSGAYVLSSPGRDYPIPAGNETLFVESDKGVARDSFEDEVSLVIEVRGRLMLLSGCSHRGIANIVDACRRRFPTKKLDVVVGGLHTRKDPPDVLEKVADRLREIPRIYAGHCTGEEAFGALSRRLGSSVFACPAGTRISLGGP